MNQFMEVEEKIEKWEYLLINGKSRQLEVKNPKIESGILVSLDEIRNYPKEDTEKNKIEHTAAIANEEKRRLYNEFFKKPFKNLLVLSGAGSSIGIGKGSKVGLSMNSLWDKAKDNYSIKDKKDGFAIICEAVNFNKERKDLEALLSQIEGHCKFNNSTKIKLDNVDVDLSEIRKDIFKLIKEACSIEKPNSNEFPHKVFLEKILQRKQTNPRVKIFTLNYDLLFEYAATEVNAIVIDGFSYTIPRTFSGRYFDYDIVQREGSKLQEEDNFIQRVFHLHKLHGSVNWKRDKRDGNVIISEKVEEPLMVYPREAKYEDSYEQPFFEMMARFQRNLRLNNDTLLICVGYSFNDKHINAAIFEALNQNPGFRLAVIDPYFFDDSNISEAMKAIKTEALNTERIIMVSETFTDFATHFPELKTYDSPEVLQIRLKNEQSKD